MKYLFVITGYSEEILGVQEVIPDMEEVEQKKDKEGYDSILNNCKFETIVKYEGFDYFDMSKNMVTAEEITKYNSHEVIAWHVFNDEKWMDEHYKGPVEEPPYYY